MTKKNTIQNFWDRVDKSGECWIWTAYTNKQGYGIIQIDGKKYKTYRISFFLANGYYPKLPMMVCHKCNNPICVNPNHLYEGNHKDNKRDSILAGTAYFGYKKGEQIGEKNNQAKLTEQDVLEIRSLRDWANMSQQGIADIYGVDRGTIRDICNYKNWKHLP